MYKTRMFINKKKKNYPLYFPQLGYKIRFISHYYIWYLFHNNHITLSKYYFLKNYLQEETVHH